MSIKTYEVRDVPGYPGFKADTEGKVFSPMGKEVGSTVSKGKNKGYVTVKTKDGYRGRHQLVCLAFHGLPPTALHEVGHLNDIHGDDRPDNLKWMTRKENEILKVRNLKSKNCKLSDSDVLEIRRLSALGKTMASLAQDFNCSKSNIHLIVTRQSWTHI